MKRISQNVTLSHVSPGSAFKIGAVVGFLGWAIFGVLWVVLQYVILSGTRSSYYGTVSINSGALCLSYFIMMVVSAIGGGIGGAIYAWLYNLAVGWVGGLEVTLEGYVYISEESSSESGYSEKPKRSVSVPLSQSTSRKECPHCGHLNTSWRDTCENCGKMLD
jgi:lipid-A-disaccharide synthase-like uncharacterized protein